MQKEEMALQCEVMESWANAEWFTNRPEVPDKVLS